METKKEELLEQIKLLTKKIEGQSKLLTEIKNATPQRHKHVYHTVIYADGSGRQECMYCHE